MNDDLLDNASKLSMEYGSKISLCATGRIIWDSSWGKGTEIFDSYIHYCSKHPFRQPMLT